MEKKLMNAQEVAEQMGITAEMVLQFAKEKKLRCIRLGFRTIKFTQEAIDTFIEEWQNPNVITPDFEED